MAQLTLLLQNSSGQLGVGIAEGERLLFDSSVDSSLTASRNVLEHLESARSQLGQSLDDMGEIFVDVGPGGLGATRTTAAFANALAYAKGIAVTGVNAFSLIGSHVARSTDRPVICIRHAARPHFYVGRFEDGRLHDFAFLEKQAVLDLVTRTRDSAVFAGKFKFGPDDVGIAPPSVANAASMLSFLLFARSVDHPSRGAARVFPITESLEAHYL
ncbi:hypothetical protein [Yoonia sediminilitoris]|uniref:tRNA threonylcarbamoyladenosine biosynthesis protein TsaB n=1 Tax=Yoonia sediminilitoris TaxID=1286148 RepID=A0A2T6KAL2_9RHOB|nr:hypothetical protein [Yoonia sediminilitoris]PUB11828.1 tRNA threonylcarbamoyladenosine biosynthesis protein TsaB [Yoonia sediminilitoris]RCW91905.1 tRNA threonylcarbamoyladenosine biosynthesis protein TsaB [Yoonia sediminilitoris]